MTNVLVVDDMAFNRAYYGKLARKLLNWKVIDQAASGHRAIEKVKELNPDVVFMDYVLPDMEGSEAIREIKKFNPKIKIVALTAAVDVEKVAKAMNSAGADVFLSKPINPLDFKKKLANMMR